MFYPPKGHEPTWNAMTKAEQAWAVKTDLIVAALGFFFIACVLPYII